VQIVITFIVTQLKGTGKQKGRKKRGLKEKKEDRSKFLTGRYIRPVSQGM